jgi:LacI family transcriptional regulator
MDRRRWLADGLARLEKPLAVFASDYDLAVDILDGAADRGLLVPEQVSLVCETNDDTMCELAPVPLSSLCHDYEEQAYRAAVLLDQLMDGRRPPSSPILIAPRALTVRRSSDITAIEHVGAARAVRVIRKYLHDRRLSVSGVARLAGLSRRGLDRAFHNHLGRSVAAEIAHLRLEEAMELLRTTRASALTIAEACGYSDAKHLRRAFRRELRLTPREFRLQNQRAVAGCDGSPPV